MKITVKYIAPLQSDGPKEETREYQSGMRVGEIVESLHFPRNLLGMTLLNGHYADFESTVNDGDIISLLPLINGG